MSKIFKNKLAIILVIIFTLLSFVAVVFFATNVQVISADNALSDSGTFTANGDTRSFSFNLPANVDTVTITVNGEAGTDFDITNVYNTPMQTKGAFYFSETRGVENEVLDVKYPDPGDWYFDVWFPYDSLGSEGFYSVSVDYTILPPDPSNTVFTKVGHLNDFDNESLIFATPNDATRVVVELNGTVDLDLTPMLARFYNSLDYIPTFESGNQELIEVDYPEFQDWSSNVTSDGISGRYRVVVYYELNPPAGSEIYSIYDSLYGGTNTHTFNLDSSVRNLYFSLITQDPAVDSVTFSVSATGYGEQTNDRNTRVYHKAAKLFNPPTGEYTIFVWSDIGEEVDYEIKVFSEDFIEYENSITPTVNLSESGYFANAVSPGLSIDVSPEDNMVLLFVSYRIASSGIDSSYLGYVGDQNNSESFTKVGDSDDSKKCYSILQKSAGNDLTTEIWYKKLIDPVAEVLDFDFNFQGNPSSIEDLHVTAVTISNATSGAFLFTDTYCIMSGDSNAGIFDMYLNAKSKDLILGTFLTDTNRTINPNGSSIFSRSGSTASANVATGLGDFLSWTTSSTVTNYSAATIAIRANGPALSPFSTTIVPDGNPPEDLENPIINLNVQPTSPSAGDVRFAGSIRDDISVSSASYTIDGGTPITIDLSGPIRNKSFDFTISGLTNGNRSVVITAVDQSNKTAFTAVNFEYLVDTEAPFCTLPSQDAVVYTNTVTYTGVVCTDDTGIASVSLQVYQDSLADFNTIYLENLTTSNLEDGAFGDLTENVSFTVPAILPDRIVFVRLTPFDLAGNPATFRAGDFFTVEAHDNTPPTLSLEPVRPDPLVDTTPQVTGICSDRSLYDTNSAIINLRYRLDGGSWIDVLPLDGSFGDIIERFSFELPEVDTSMHVVEVECADSSSLEALKSDEFSIIEPFPVSPELITQTESFLNHSNHVFSESDLIWGNGQLRLREEITTTRTLIDNVNYPNKYVNTNFNRYLVKKDEGDPNTIWYSRTGEIVSYNGLTNTVTPLDPSAWGLTDLTSPIQSFRSVLLEGKRYLWASDIYRLQVYNLTDNIAVEFPARDGVSDILPDNKRGRLGAYLIEDTQLSYLDLGGTLTNTSDDQHSYVPGDTIPGGMEVYYDELNGDIYVNRYNYGLYKFNDNNTPLNFTDDQVGSYTNDRFENLGNVFSMLVDPNGYLLVGIAGYYQTGALFVVLSDNNTPYNTTDDPILKLADPSEIKNLNIYDLEYIEGEDGVGDQIFMGGELSDAYYLNFNSTYTDQLDDTFIRLSITTNNRGIDNNDAYRGSASYIVHDYNTLYVNGDVDGFQRYDLTRGWADSGQSVVFSTPENRLVTNYFELRDIDQSSDIILSSSTPVEEQNIFQRIWNYFFPSVQAQGSPITYSVSVDDGINWSPISLAEILSFNQNDYRVKFRINMSETSGASPVLDSYTLAFGAYQDEVQLETFELSLNAVPNTSQATQNFGLEVKVIDQLGFSDPDFNGPINLTLVDSNTLQDYTSRLNTTTANLVNGEVTLSNIQISQPGTYLIRGVYNSTTYSSNVITITPSTSIPVPSILFTSNRSTINLGESVTLQWDSENLTALSMNRGVGVLNTLDGSLTLSPTTTTVYTISGTGPYGALERSITITVIQPSTGEPTGSRAEDSDNDGLANDQELVLGTDPNDPDSDDDGLLDGEEIDACIYLEGTLECGDVTFNQTDPNNANTDGDGLLDGEEVRGCYFTLGSTLCSDETFDPTDPTDPNDPGSIPVQETQFGRPTVTIVESETQGLNIIEQIIESVEDGSESGTLPVSLIATTAVTTTVSAVAYPNLFSFIFLWFRKRKKLQNWGTIYNKSNNTTIPFVTVRLLDGSRNFVAEEISDLNGKYSIASKPGKYILQTKINGFKDSEQVVNSAEESINLDISIMPVDAQRNLVADTKEFFQTNIPKVSAYIFYFGFIFAVISLLSSFSVLNLLAVILFGTQIIFYYIVKRDAAGKVFDTLTGKTLKGIFVRVYSKKENRQIGTTITDEKGRYSLFLIPGEYIVKLENPEFGIDESATSLRDALGTPYLEVRVEKPEVLKLVVPMVKKTSSEFKQSGFGFMG